MFDWVANAVGITDGNHGASAVHSVAEQTSRQQWTGLARDDLRWELMQGTNVETKVFYMTSTGGKLGLAQIIYSDVLGVRTTAHFNLKIIDAQSAKRELWTSDNIDKFEFSPDKHDFLSDSVTMKLSGDGMSYHIKSVLNKDCVVDLTFTRSAPGFVAGADGTSTFGTDRSQPWGRMRHLFWPRCNVQGSVLTRESGEVNFSGRGMFIHALQGMKPHFAAASWNFVNFQSPNYSAVLMEYTTPPSYGKTVVTVGAITSGDDILLASSQPAAVHRETNIDPESGWPEPSAITYKWAGKTSDGNDVSAELSGSIVPRVDRIGVMDEIPGFLRQIIVNASRTSPYIYQYCPRLTLKLRIDDQMVEEEGQLFIEAVFIS